MANTIFDLLAEAGPQPFEGRAPWARYAYRLITTHGRTPVRASYDEVTGSCTICGRCAACPGWHTVEETLADQSVRAPLPLAPQ
jgi:hypothetical protein